MPTIGDDWLTIALRLGVATLIKMMLGFEREWRRHDAGLLILTAASLLERWMPRRDDPDDGGRTRRGATQSGK